MGLPPYLEDGVPGRGLPLMSAGSYVGRLDELVDEVREGDHDLVGDGRLGE